MERRIVLILIGILALVGGLPSHASATTTRHFVIAAEDSTPMFRGMQPDGDGPMVGSTAKTLGARPGVDIPVGDDGMVSPGTGGMPVNDSATGMPEYRRPPALGGSGKDLNMYCMDSCDLPPGLNYRPDPGLPGHGFVEPGYLTRTR